MPRLSIITINFNNCEGLQKTMESVFAQTFKDYEYIIIDGGSIDGSKEYISQNSDKLSYWVSEKDNGIYHAMNKGIQKSKGEYLLFLNSGDYLYCNDSLSRLLKSGYTEDIIYGDLLMKEIDGREWVFSTPEKLTFGFLLKSSLPHQTALIRKSLFEKTGLYNESFKIISDWEFFIKAICVFNCSHRYVKDLIAVFNMEGISAQVENKELIKKERQQVLVQQYGIFLDEYSRFYANEAELNNYRNSRAHKIIDRILKSSVYRKLKK